ncbi:MAG: hypothetical protein PHW00_02765 [Clostridia bacterium]|nr:hypothetical protein [Clostridia bacterium]
MAITITNSIPNNIKLKEKAIALVGDEISNRPQVKDNGSNAHQSTTTDVKGVYSELVKKLDNVEHKYSTDYIEPEIEYDQTLGLEKIEYEMPTREEAHIRAEQILEPNYNKDKAKVESNLNKAQVQADTRISQIRQETQQKIDTLNDNFKNQLEDIKRNAIDRGVARSSIINSERDNAHQEVESVADTLHSQAEGEIVQLEKGIQEARQQAQQALDTLKQSYDSEVVNQITEILQQAIKDKVNAIKYNNTVNERETKYQISRQNAISKANADELDRQNTIYDLISQYGVDTVNRRKYEEKYQIVKQYLDTLSKYDALKLCQSTSAIKQHLGPSYNALIEYLMNK